jgi:hypothetical protein
MQHPVEHELGQDRKLKTERRGEGEKVKVTRRQKDEGKERR